MLCHLTAEVCHSICAHAWLKEILLLLTLQNCQVPPAVHVYTFNREASHPSA